MTCLRCHGLVVDEYLLNLRERSLSSFSTCRCLNGDATHDDVIRLNQCVPLPLRRVQPPVAGLARAEESLPWFACNRRMVEEGPLMLGRCILAMDDDLDLQSILG